MRAGPLLALCGDSSAHLSWATFRCDVLALVYSSVQYHLLPIFRKLTQSLGTHELFATLKGILHACIINRLLGGMWKGGNNAMFHPPPETESSPVEDVGPSEKGLKRAERRGKGATHTIYGLNEPPIFIW